MDAERLLARLEGEAVRLEVVGDRLKLDAPAGVLTPARIAEVRQHRDRLVALLRGRAGGEPHPLTPIAPAQSAFLDPAAAMAGAEVFVAHRLRGELRADAVARSIAWLVSRHEILRTTFEPHAGAMVQRVHATAPAACTSSDLTGTPDAGAALMPFLDRQRVARFDPGTLPLFRVALIRLAPREHVLTIALHHGIADAGALEVLFRELVLAYRAYAGGRRPEAPPLRMQYREWAARAWARLAPAVIGAPLDLWERQLASARDVMPELAAGGRGPATCLTQTRVLDAAETGAVHALARAARVSVPAVLAGAFQLVIARRTGWLDVPLLTFASDRDRQELRAMIGLFVTTVLLRVPIVPRRSVAQWLAAVHGALGRSVAQRALPFELVDRLAREHGRPLDTRAVARIGVNHVRASPRAPDADLDVTPIDVARVTPLLDLLLVTVEEPARIVLTLEASAARFERAWLAPFLDDYAGVLRRVLAAPDASVAGVLAG